MEYYLVFCLRLKVEKIPITNYNNIEQKPLPFSITTTVSKMNDDYLDYTYEDPYAVQPERLRPGRHNMPPKVPPKGTPKVPPKMVVPKNRIVQQEGTFYIQFLVEKFVLIIPLKISFIS